MPPTLAHREDIPDLPQVYRTTTNEGPFLVYYSRGGDKERIFVFASQDALQIFGDSEHWYCINFMYFLLIWRNPSSTNRSLVKAK